MLALLAQVVPTAIAGGLAVFPILAVVTMLMSERGPRKAAAYIAGQTVTFVALGAVALALSVTATDPVDPVVTGSVIALVGVVLLLAGFKLLVSRKTPANELSALLARLDGMPVPTAGVVGVVSTILNLKQIGIYTVGVAQILDAEVSVAQRWLALAIVIAVIQIPVVTEVAVYVLAGAWATRVLARLRSWLVRRVRVISVTIGLVVGVVFVLRGVSQVAGA